MHHRLIGWTIFALAARAALAQAPPPEPPIAQALLSEIHQLRSDLQTTAATIQRVQIVMYRLQAQAAAVDRAAQRLDAARAQADGFQWQQKRLAGQIETLDARARSLPNGAERQAAAEEVVNLKANLEEFRTQEQQFQADRADAENQLRAEQAKDNDLEEQLEKLDKLLAGFSAK